MTQRTLKSYKQRLPDEDSSAIRVDVVYDRFDHFVHEECQHNRGQSLRDQFYILIFKHNLVKEKGKYLDKAEGLDPDVDCVQSPFVEFDKSVCRVEKDNGQNDSDDYSKPKSEV